MIVGGVVMPGEPVLIPEVGRGRERDAVKTVGGCRQAARFVAACAPDTAVIAFAGTDSAPTLWHPPGGELWREFAALDAPELRRPDPVDSELARTLSTATGGSSWSVRKDDQAPAPSLLALVLLLGESGRRVLAVETPASLPSALNAGERLAEAADMLGRRLVVVAAGHLASAPERSARGYRADAAAFDERILASLEHGDRAALLAVTDAERAAMAETLLSPLAFLLGAMGAGSRVEPLTYQHPFGTGYAVALLHHPDAPDPA